MMEPFRRGKLAGHANKSHHQRGRRPFTRDFLCSSLVLTSIRAIITPAPPPFGFVFRGRGAFVASASAPFGTDAESARQKDKIKARKDQSGIKKEDF